jgi:RHS repeat-associated protein
MTTDTLQYGTVDPWTVASNDVPNNASTPDAVNSRLQLSSPTPAASAEPVDLASGAYFLDHTDLALGSGEPKGLSFSRSYDSSLNRTKRTLGYGWTYNYDIYITPTSHGEPGLGSRQPVDAASFVAALYVMLDIVKTQDNIQGWMAAALAGKWAVDQVINNAVVVHLGKKVSEYIKLADGTYANPPGSTTQLVTNSDGTNSLLERFGARTDFDTSKRIAKVTDVDGNALAFTYTGANLTTVRDAFNRTLTLGYDTSSRINSVLDSTGRSVGFGYNANGELASYTDPEQKSWGYGYSADNSHRMTSLVNPLKITTATNVYDSLGRVMTQTVPRQTQTDGSTTATYNFYFSGYRNVEQDPAGHTTTYYFDGKGRTVAEEDALGNRAAKQYDGQNHLVLSTDPRQYSTSYLYDGNQNLNMTTNAVGVLDYKTTYQYDSLLRLSDIFDPSQHNTHFGYDTRHHLTRIQDNLLNTTKATYNGPKGSKDTATDGRTTQTLFTYDSYGNPQTSKTSAHPAITYVYDPIGRMTDLTDQTNSHTSFIFDKRNLLNTVTDPSRVLKTQLRYYDDGSLNSKTDRKENTITYFNTPSGKLDHKSYPNGATVNYKYNNLDQLTAMQDSVGSTGYGYDPDGRVNSVTDPNGFSVSSLFDAAGNLSELTYPGNKKVIYTYDELNRLHTVKIDWLPGKPVATYNYKVKEIDLLDNLVQFNGITTTYGFDTAHRLNGISIPSVASYSFPTIDGNGNRTSVTQTEPLTPVAATASIGYIYNSTKNRLQSAGANSFGYDNEGQLSSGYGTSYTFDYEHRLTAMSGASYTYDGNGNRLQATRSGVSTRYIYDASGNLLAEADGSNNITRYYIYGQGLLAMVTSAGQVYCYHYNAVGSTVAMTDQTQAMVNKYTYDAFGNIGNQVEAVPQPFKYVGQYGVMAEPNGFFYMKARYYDPKVGRFVSEDPTGFGGGDVNLMAYVQNNPISGIDPSGQITWYAGGGITLYWGGKGNVTASAGAIIYSDKTGLLNGNFITYGAERTEVETIHTTTGAGAGGGPVLGFFTGSLTGFKGETRNVTLDVLGAAVTYSENNSGRGLSASWGGKGFGLGSYINTTNTITTKCGKGF